MNRWLGSVLLTAVLTVGTAFHSQAFFETADGLTAHCNNDDVLRFTECVAFLKGVADGLRTLAFREQRCYRCLCREMALQVTCNWVVGGSLIAPARAERSARAAEASTTA